MKQSLKLILLLIRLVSLGIHSVAFASEDPEGTFSYLPRDPFSLLLQQLEIGDLLNLSETSRSVRDRIIGTLSDRPVVVGRNEITEQQLNGMFGPTGLFRNARIVRFNQPVVKNIELLKKLPRSVQVLDFGRGDVSLRKTYRSQQANGFWTEKEILGQLTPSEYPFLQEIRGIEDTTPLVNTLMQFDQIRTLDCHATQRIKPEQFAEAVLRFKELRNLVLTSTSLFDQATHEQRAETFRNLGNLVHLESLILTRHRAFGNVYLSHLLRRENIESLPLLTQLKSLSLFGCRFDHDLGLKTFLERLPNLTELSLNASWFDGTNTQFVPSKVFAKTTLPRGLLKLSIAFPKFQSDAERGEVQAWIESLPEQVPHLEHLELSSFSPAMYRIAQRLPHLKTLKLVPIYLNTENDSETLDGIIELFRSRNPSVQDLAIGFPNYVQGEDVDSICMSLNRWPRLKNFTLNMGSFTNEGVCSRMKERSRGRIQIKVTRNPLLSVVGDCF